MDSTSFDIHLEVDEPRSAQAYFTEQTIAPEIRPSRRLLLGNASVGDAEQGQRLDEAIATLHEMWDAGFLHVDTAPRYGNGEWVAGEALRRWDGPRPTLCTKFGCESDRTRRHDVPWLEHSFERSKKRLEGSRIDMLAVHEAHWCAPEDCQPCIDLVRSLLPEGCITGSGLGGVGHEADVWLDAGIFNYMITYLRVNAVSLQALADTVPQARERGIKVMVGSPMFFGLITGQPAAKAARSEPFVIRAKAVHQLADDAGLSLPHLAIRFLLSMPAIDFVLCGPGNPSQGADCRKAYEAGPLPADLYQSVWQVAQQGTEPMVGG